MNEWRVLWFCFLSIYIDIKLISPVYIVQTFCHSVMLNYKTVPTITCIRFSNYAQMVPYRERL